MSRGKAMVCCWTACGGQNQSCASEAVAAEPERDTTLSKVFLSAQDSMQQMHSIMERKNWKGYFYSAMPIPNRPVREMIKAFHFVDDNEEISVRMSRTGSVVAWLHDRPYEGDYIVGTSNREIRHILFSMFRPYPTWMEAMMMPALTTTLPPAEKDMQLQPTRHIRLPCWQRVHWMRRTACAFRMTAIYQSRSVHSRSMLATRVRTSAPDYTEEPLWPRLEQP